MYELDTHILDNGLTVSISPSATSPMVAIQAWVRVGSADDPPSKAGLAHLVEHLLFKGSRHYRSGELAGVIERAGGEVNAWTSPDQTVFHAVVRRAYFPEALEALSDTLVEPRFEPGELERERSVVLQELRHGGGTVERLLGKCLLSTAFLMHPYRRPVIGSEDTLSAIAVRDVADLYRGFYVGPNLTLVIAGDVDREDVLRRVALRFGGLPAARPPRRSIREPAQGTPRVAVVEHTAPGARLAIAFPAPALRDPEVAALEVAAVVLSQRASFAAVAGGDAGPTGYVRALHDASLFVVEAAPAPAALAAAVTGLLRELRGLSQDLEQQELERAQAALELERERQLETVQGRARALGWHAAMTGDAGFERVHAERVRRLRRGEVSAALARQVVAERASVAAVVPRSWRGRRVFAQAAPARVRKALPPARQRPVAQERRHVLPNGMTLLVRRDPGARLVAMRAAWAGGVRLEEDRTSGAAAMLARLLSRGCGKRRAAEVASRLDELGGSLEGVVGRNSFGASAEWLSDSWRDGLELMADCLLAPRLDEVEVASVRRQLLGELAAQATRPGRRALQVFLRALYGGHPYHRDVLGTEQSLARLSRNALRELYQQRFPVSSLALAVVGDVDPDEVVALVSARFASAPRRVAPAVTVTPPSFAGRPQTEREVYAYLDDPAQAHLVVGFPGATVAGPERLPLEVLGAALGGQSGRLFLELRERRGLAYQVAVHVTEGLDPGYLAIHVACAPDKLDEVHAVIRQELERLLGDGLTEDEAQRARNYVIGAHDTAMQRRSAVAAAMAYHEVYGLPWQLWQEHAQKVASLDAPALLAVARAHLRWDLAVTATVRPEAGSPEVSRRGQRGARRKASVPSGGERRSRSGRARAGGPR